MNLKIIRKTSNRYPNFCGIHIAKTGVISIYKLAIEKMDLKEGEQIALIQDNDKPDDFFLIKMKAPELPKIKYNHARTHFQVHYSDAYKALIDHFKLEKKGYRITLGGAIRTDWGTAWCLITAPLKEIAKEVSNA